MSSTGIYTSVSRALNNCESKEVGEIATVLASMVSDVRSGRITLDRVKMFFVRNRVAIEALLDICGVGSESFDAFVNELVKIVAREATFSLGGMLREYSQFVTGETKEEEQPKKPSKIL
ncbi:MAG: hypothetical protein QXK11_07285 [Pyrobaculum sp.]|uniref:hypothetical protein n=1 Tax=Pyrobaculum sp. TaxID=2004705 RepID=UPI003181E29A